MKKLTNSPVSKMTKVLIFRNQGLGDLILITPAIRAIRSLHPTSEISVFVGDWSKASAENHPAINEIISYPDSYIQDKKPFKIISLINRLRRKNFDRVYIFHSHNVLHLMTKLAGIPERYGFSFRGTGKLLTHSTEWQPNTSRYIADNYLDIPRLSGYIGNDLSLDLYLTDQEKRAAGDILSINNLNPGQYFIFAPGGGINPRQNVFEKRWGEEKFAALIDLLSENFTHKVILTGAAAEKLICEKIVSLCKSPLVDLCGKIPFRISAALVKSSKALICNDSAIMHTAVAFGTPSVAIFGPSNPLSLLPVNPLNRWVSSGIDCSPCYCNEIFTGCPKDLECMKKLNPEKVLQVLLKTIVVQ